MFARVKKSGSYQYLQLVENRRENGKVLQRVLVTLGRLDQMTEKGGSRIPDSLFIPLFRESAFDSL